MKVALSSKRRAIIHLKINQDQFFPNKFQYTRLTL